MRTKKYTDHNELTNCEEVNYSFKGKTYASQYTGLPSYTVTWLQSYIVKELQSYIVTNLQNYRDTESQSYKAT